MGYKSFFGTLLILVLFIACRREAVSVGPQIIPPDPSAPGADSGVVRYLALGDSYTIGQSVDPGSRFPIQTRNWLIGNGIQLSEPQIIATTGWTTSNLQSAIARVDPKGPFDIVTLLIGVNDQYQGADPAGYETRFTQLLEQAIGLAGNRPWRVIVLSIPDYSVTPFARNYDTQLIREEIDQFNAINKRITLSRQAGYLDITPSTREAANDPSLLAGDGLHPSGKEYKRWSDQLGPMIKAALTH